MYFLCHLLGSRTSVFFFFFFGTKYSSHFLTAIEGTIPTWQISTFYESRGHFRKPATKVNIEKTCLATILKKPSGQETIGKKKNNLKSPYQMQQLPQITIKFAQTAIKFFFKCYFFSHLNIVSVCADCENVSINRSVYQYRTIQ